MKEIHSPNKYQIFFQCNYVWFDAPCPLSKFSCEKTDVKPNIIKHVECQGLKCFLGCKYHRRFGTSCEMDNPCADTPTNAPASSIDPAPSIHPAPSIDLTPSSAPASPTDSHSPLLDHQFWWHSFHLPVHCKIYQWHCFLRSIIVRK